VEWVEVTARTVEDAKDKALDYLGVDESQAEFEVLEQPRTGLFGRLKGEARVRARVRPAQPRPKVDRRDRRRRKGREDDAAAGPARRSNRGDEANARRDEGRTTEVAAPSSGRADASETSGSAAPTHDAAPSRGSARDAARSPGGGERGDARSGEGRDHSSRRPRPARGGRSEAGGPLSTSARDRADAVSPIASPNAEEGSSVVSDEVNEQAIAREVEAADVFLRGLLDAFGLDAQVETVVHDELVRELRVSGNDLGLLIGPRGGTIEAVQELTRLAARRGSNGRTEARLRVDVGGYRERRREALARFARGLAEEVRDSGAQKVLEPMSSPDRKVVHDAASEVDGVVTLSEGEEPRRRVVIVPRP
jgi:spoIIIJ-associated protein